jgi:hypothetical protein
MEKYSQKIQSFINNELASIIDVNSVCKEIAESNFVENIAHIVNMKNSNSKTMMTRTGFHKRTGYKLPMIYSHVRNLYFNKKVKFGGLTDSHFDNFYEFTKWYKNHHHELRTEELFNTKNDDRSECYKYLTQKVPLHTILYRNDFVSLDIQHDAELNDIIEYSYEDNDNKIIIYNYVGDDFHNKIIDKILHISRFMRAFAKKNIYTNMIIFLSKQKKKINEGYDEKILTPMNTNSGSSMTEKYVYIWRREEVLKICIHELMHYYGIDFHDSDSNGELKNYYKNKFNLKCHIPSESKHDLKIHPECDCSNESYAESLAILIHSCFCSYYSKMPLIKVLQNEIVFTVFQNAKILNYFGITKSDDISKKGFNQSTSVLSYFHIKGLLLFNSKKLFDFIDDIDLFINSDSKIKKFENIIIEDVDDLEFYDNINKVLMIYEDIKSENVGKFVLKTMRMTCCDF